MSYIITIKLFQDKEIIYAEKTFQKNIHQMNIYLFETKTPEWICPVKLHLTMKYLRTDN